MARRQNTAAMWAIGANAARHRYDRGMARTSRAIPCPFKTGIATPPARIFWVASIASDSDQSAADSLRSTGFRGADRVQLRDSAERLRFLRKIG
jgi:hypothetical protein